MSSFACFFFGFSEADEMLRLRLGGGVLRVVPPRVLGF